MFDLLLVLLAYMARAAACCPLHPLQHHAHTHSPATSSSCSHPSYLCNAGGVGGRCRSCHSSRGLGTPQPPASLISGRQQPPLTQRQPDACAALRRLWAGQWRPLRGRQQRDLSRLWPSLCDQRAALTRCSRCPAATRAAATLDPMPDPMPDLRLSIQQLSSCAARRRGCSRAAPAAVRHEWAGRLQPRCEEGLYWRRVPVARTYPACTHNCTPMTAARCVLANTVHPSPYRRRRPTWHALRLPQQSLSLSWVLPMSAASSLVPGWRLGAASALLRCWRAAQLTTSSNRGSTGKRLKGRCPTCPLFNLSQLRLPDPSPDLLL